MWKELAKAPTHVIASHEVQEGFIVLVEAGVYIIIEQIMTSLPLDSTQKLTLRGVVAF